MGGSPCSVPPPSGNSVHVVTRSVVAESPFASLAVIVGLRGQEGSEVAVDIVVVVLVVLVAGTRDSQVSCSSSSEI